MRSIKAQTKAKGGPLKQVEPKRLEASQSLTKPKVLERPVSEEEEVIKKIKEEQIRISTTLDYLQDYGPQYYKTEWNQHYRVLKQATNSQEENPLNWTIGLVAESIAKVCENEEISSRFKEQEIDGSALLDLSKEDLTNLLSIKMGPSIKIFHFIEKLRNKVCEEFVVFEDEDNEFGHLKN